MTLGETVIAVWQQALADEKPAVELNNTCYRVTKTRSAGLRTVRFNYGDHQVDAIEQNPKTASRWAALAREGKRIMQFSYQGRYIGNVSEGDLVRYSSWGKLGLPE